MLKPVRFLAENYRCIEKVEFSIDEVGLLIGRNNSGKSATLDAIRCFYSGKLCKEEDHRRGKASPPIVEITYGDDTQRIVVRRDLSVTSYTVGEATQTPKKLPSKFGTVIYVPAVTLLKEQTKTSGPSPLRDLTQSMVKQAVGDVSTQTSFAGLSDSIESAMRTKGLGELETALDRQLTRWKGSVKFRLKAPDLNKLALSMVELTFEGRPVSEYGTGFQRQLIASLLQIEVERSSNNDGLPKLLLFEEPEAFQHPAQQRHLTSLLRELGKKPDWTVLATTHGPRIVQHLTRADRMDTVVRLVPATDKRGSVAFHPKDMSGLLTEARKKGESIAGKKADESMPEVDRFRYEVDINAESAAMFFADLVLLVEGATEMGVFRRLLSTGRLNLRTSTEIVQAHGKFGILRYLAILNAFGIATVVIHDKDGAGKLNHPTWNRAIREACQQCKFAGEPIVLDPDLERSLGWHEASDRQKHLKPAFAMKELAELGDGEHAELTKLWPSD